jgi:hypothetical protein
MTKDLEWRKSLYTVSAEPLKKMPVPAMRLRVEGMRGESEFFLTSEQAREWMSVLLRGAVAAEEIFSNEEHARDAMDFT